jgi:hypothetical protein
MEEDVKKMDAEELGRFECAWCGRVYEDGIMKCTSDDCPGRCEHLEGEDPDAECSCAAAGVTA